jgi:hypothetical protein
MRLCISLRLRLPRRIWPRGIWPRGIWPRGIWQAHATAPPNWSAAGIHRGNVPVCYYVCMAGCTANTKLDIKNNHSLFSQSLLMFIPLLTVARKAVKRRLTNILNRSEESRALNLTFLHETAPSGFRHGGTEARRRYHESAGRLSRTADDTQRHTPSVPGSSVFGELENRFGS